MKKFLTLFLTFITMLSVSCVTKSSSSNNSIISSSPTSTFSSFLTQSENEVNSSSVMDFTSSLIFSSDTESMVQSSINSQTLTTQVSSATSSSVFSVNTSVCDTSNSLTSSTEISSQLTISSTEEKSSKSTSQSKSSILSSSSSGESLSSNSSSTDSSSTSQPTISDYTYPQNTVLTDYVDYSTKTNAGKISQFNSQKWFYNELSVPLADVFVYEENNIYYIYGSTDRTICSTVDCYVTTDFKNYTHFPNVYVPRQGSWEKCGENNALIFAPELIKYEGYYYLSYSNKAQADNVRYISVVKSASPTGPFAPIGEYNSKGEYINGYSAPIFNNNPTGIDVLDQHYLFDGEDIYLYYSVYHTGDCEYIVGVKMFDILTPDWSTYKILVKPGKAIPTATENLYPWETYISWFPVVEAPTMIKSPNGKYYLTYSINHYPYRYYSICYAYSDSPLGDYQKPYVEGQEWTNLLFGYAGPKEGDVYEDWAGVMSGCAHHSIFQIGEQYMIGYHAHKNRGMDTATNWVPRAAAIDFLHFDKNGVPYGEGPTYSLQFLPERISGYKNLAPQARLKTRNLGNIANLTDNYIVSNHNLVQKFNTREVIVGQGLSYAIFDLGANYKIGGISIYNSSKYEYAITEVEYINLLNDNVIFKPKFPNVYWHNTKEFVNPASAINIELNDVVTSKVIICFNAPTASKINEVRIYGKPI